MFETVLPPFSWANLSIMEMLVLTPKSIICRVLNYFLAFPWSSHTLLRVFFTFFLHFPLAFPSDGPIFFFCWSHKLWPRHFPALIASCSLLALWGVWLRAIWLQLPQSFPLIFPWFSLSFPELHLFTGSFHMLLRDFRGSFIYYDYLFCFT